MNLQKKLIQLSEYKCSFKYVEQYFLVTMTYPTNWSIIPSEDKSIEVAEENGVTFYAAPIETDIEKAFNLIDDTISYNLDVEKKVALLKYNIGKLQELFSEKDLDELETIEFVFKPKKIKEAKESSKSMNSTKKTTRKPYTRKKKETVKEPQFVSEEIKPLDEEYVNDTFDEETEDNNLPIIGVKYLEEVER